MRIRFRRDSGFTLVELLVVIAIIGILIALLLPAVQAAREAARRTQCSNNFKQVGLALHNYHAALATFPPGQLLYHSSLGCSGHPSGSYQGFGWATFILPYLELESIYSEIDFNVTVYTNPAAWPAARHRIGAYVCPSDAHNGGWIECCTGVQNGPQSVDDQRSVNIAGVGDSHQVWCNLYIATPNGNGILHSLNAVKIAQIGDGTSNTLMAGEVTGARGAHPSEGQAMMGYTWFNRNLQDMAKGINGFGSVPGGRNETADPIDGDGGNRHSELYTEVGFSSFHPGGANFVLADGSVRFIGANVDQTLLESLATRYGSEVVTMP